MEVPVDPLKLLGIALCVAGVLVLGLCVWCHRKHRRRRRQIARLQRSTVGSSRRQLSTSGSSRRQHVCDELGERFASVDSV